MKDSFSQKDAAGYLAKCESQDQVQDVLTAYASHLSLFQSTRSGAKC